MWSKKRGSRCVLRISYMYCVSCFYSKRQSSGLDVSMVACNKLHTAECKLTEWDCHIFYQRLLCNCEKIVITDAIMCTLPIKPSPKWTRLLLLESRSWLKAEPIGRLPRKFRKIARYKCKLFYKGKKQLPESRNFLLPLKPGMFG